MFSGTDEGGTSGTIIFSDDPANYKYLEIYYRDDQLFQYSNRIRNNYANSLNFVLYYSKASAVSDTIFIISKRMSLSSSGIVRGIGRFATVANGATITVADNNDIRIVEVVGYKY